MSGPVIGARLTSDGTLYTVGALDDTGQVKTGHKITVDTIFTDELDEFTLNNNSTSGGSITLNGSTQKIDITGSSDFMFGTGDFTIEGWFYLTSTSYTRLWCFPDGDNVECSNGTLYYWNGGANIISAGAGTAPQNAWFHVALVKKDNYVNVYLNGTSVITDNNPYNSVTSRPLTIGGEVSNLGASDNPATTGWLHGNFTNFRIVKGSAVYTKDFSTAYNPLSTLSNTVLLLNVTSSGNMLTDGSGKSHVVTNTGSATYSELTPLSTYFNGAMKQLKNGALLLANELDETQTVLS